MVLLSNRAVGIWRCQYADGVQSRIADGNYVYVAVQIIE